MRGSSCWSSSPQS
uniref:Uncharacterized protein n=1 Tax=Arundo donax TaxID=35708 RepID=A0A0A8ZCT0_ARUDO